MNAPRLGPILNAAAARVDAEGFTLHGVVAPVRRRKAPNRREQSEPPFMITVSKSPTPETVSRYRFDAIRTDYRIAITVVAPYGGPDEDLETFATWRDRLVDVFSKPPLAGAPDVFDLSAAPADFLQAGDNLVYDWFAVEVVASVVSPN